VLWRAIGLRAVHISFGWNSRSRLGRRCGISNARIGGIGGNTRIGNTRRNACISRNARIGRSGGGGSAGHRSRLVSAALIMQGENSPIPEKIGLLSERISQRSKRIGLFPRRSSQFSERIGLFSPEMATSLKNRLLHWFLRGPMDSGAPWRVSGTAPDLSGGGNSRSSKTLVGL